MIVNVFCTSPTCKEHFFQQMSLVVVKVESFERNNTLRTWWNISYKIKSICYLIKVELQYLVKKSSTIRCTLFLIYSSTVGPKLFTLVHNYGPFCSAPIPLHSRDISSFLLPRCSCHLFPTLTHLFIKHFRLLFSCVPPFFIALIFPLTP